MKNKSIDNKIKVFINLIKSIKKRIENMQTGQTKAALQTMESDLKATIGLQKEIQQLKDTLKIRKKEVLTGVRKLKDDSKEIKKAQKKDKKDLKRIKAEKKPKNQPKSKPPITASTKKKTVKPVKKQGNTKTQSIKK
jgi:hypothetical protein